MASDFESDLDALIADVVNEARATIHGPRWQLVGNERMLAVAHAVAGLLHCCQLSEEIIDAHRRDQEMTGRVLARAMFEAWGIAYYIHLGGYEALSGVAGDYRYERETQARSIIEHDAKLKIAVSSVKRRNRRLEGKNSQLSEWNRKHPDQRQKPLRALVSDPVAVPSNLDHAVLLGDMPDAPAKRLPLRTVMDRIRQLTKDRGEEEVFDLAYEMAYRGLSGIGAHANLFVLNSYLDNGHGRANFLKFREDAELGPSFSEPNRRMSLLLLAGLAVCVLGDRDEPCPVARKVLDVFNEGAQEAD